MLFFTAMFLTALFCLLITLWLIWRWRITSTFLKLGIPGPPPNILFGNLLELHWKGPLKCHEDWVRKYGRVVGYYLGMTPAILVTDPVLLKNIFIKDFHKFMDREAFNPLHRYSSRDQLRQSVMLLPGEAWKSVRSILTPTFTSAKMKQMSGSIESCIEMTIKKMKHFSDNNEIIDIFDVYQRTSLDVISRTVFGVKTDVQTNTESKLLKVTNLLFRFPYNSPLIFIGLSFPILRYFCERMQLLYLMVLFKGNNPIQTLGQGISEVIQQRKQNPQIKNTDLLQLMIDSSISEDAKEDLSELEAGNVENEMKRQEKNYSTKTTRNMSDNEVIHSAMSVLLAGYETTSTGIAFTTYLLAKHQHIQEKLYQEINKAFQLNKTLDYYTVTRLEYLDKVFSESLRLMPPVYLFTSRYALTDVQYGSLKIPKCMLIRAPPYLMHHDPEFWEDPENFDPERFSEKPNSNGITYLPFGVGPRNCLGMRFAQLKAKFVLAYVIYYFRIHLADKQQEILPISIRMRTLTPSDGVCVKLEERNHVESNSIIKNKEK